MSGYNRFRWLVRGRIAGAPHPDLEGGLPAVAEFLREQGIGAIVTLGETPLAPSPESLGFQSIYSETPDFRPPPDLAEIVGRIDLELAAGRAVLVHCFAGIGRTGTVLAAWLLRQDPSLRAEEAIARVREEYIPDYARHRFPEHESQESALVSFVATR